MGGNRCVSAVAGGTNKRYAHKPTSAKMLEYTREPTLGISGRRTNDLGHKCSGQDHSEETQKRTGVCKNCVWLAKSALSPSPERLCRRLPAKYRQQHHFLYRLAQAHCRKICPCAPQKINALSQMWTEHASSTGPSATRTYGRKYLQDLFLQDKMSEQARCNEYA